MKLPKFIVTMDGVFRLGMVDQHKHLLKPGDQCIGGLSLLYFKSETLISNSHFFDVKERVKVPGLFL